MEETTERFCPACGGELTPGSRFCSFCGAAVPVPVPTVGICPGCGARIREGQEACFGCGRRIGGAPEPEIVVIPEAEPPRPAEKKKKKRTGLWVTLAVLALVAVIAVVLVLLLQPRQAQSVRLSRERLTLIQGERFVLDYEVKPENTTDQSVTWSSDDPAVAAVEGGEVVAVGPGTCQVTVTTENGLRHSCTVVVTAQAVESVELSATELTLFVGDTAQLTGRSLPEEADTVITWSSDQESVAQVKDGTVTAVGVGTCTVTAAAGNGVQAVCAVTVALRVEEQAAAGGWTLVRIEEHYDEQSHAAKGVSVELKPDLTGSLTQDGETRAFTWRFQNVDGDGDYWYQVESEQIEELQLLYSARTGELTLYWTDESWVFTPNP